MKTLVVTMAIVLAGLLAPTAHAGSGSLLVPDELAPGYYFMVPDNQIGGLVEICGDYTCKLTGGQIDNYFVEGRTLIAVPDNAVMVNITGASFWNRETQSAA